jgi:hypothetical protein
MLKRQEHICLNKIYCWLLMIAPFYSLC